MLIVSSTPCTRPSHTQHAIAAIATEQSHMPRPCMHKRLQRNTLAETSNLHTRKQEHNAGRITMSVETTACTQPEHNAMGRGGAPPLPCTPPRPSHKHTACSGDNIIRQDSTTDDNTIRQPRPSSKRWNSTRQTATEPRLPRRRITPDTRGAYPTSRQPRLCHTSALLRHGLNAACRRGQKKSHLGRGTHHTRPRSDPTRETMESDTSTDATAQWSTAKHGKEKEPAIMYEISELRHGTERDGIKRALTR